MMCLCLSGASLVSIQDPQEGIFIQQNLELLQDGAKSFWIGLFKTHEGEQSLWKLNSASVSCYLFFQHINKLKAVPLFRTIRLSSVISRNAMRKGSHSLIDLTVKYVLV